MPSFNAQKLQELMDRRESASAAQRAINERYQDARSDKNRLQQILQTAAAGQGNQAAAYVDNLLEMPLDQAANHPKENIVGFDKRVGDRTVQRFITGIDYQLWCRYILAAQQSRRLAAQAELGRERFDAEFAIVDNLVHAVRSWGFNMQGT